MAVEFLQIRGTAAKCVVWQFRSVGSSSPNGNRAIARRPGCQISQKPRFLLFAAVVVPRTSGTWAPVVSSPTGLPAQPTAPNAGIASRLVIVNIRPASVGWIVDCRDLARRSV